MRNNNNCNFSLNFFIQFKNSFSFFSSNAFVASSKIKTLGLRYNALAIDILCNCPADKFTPLSPINELTPLGKELTSSSNCESFIALLKSSF